MSKTFIDTNVLLYTLDAGDPDRRDAARAALTELQQSQTPVISTQVLQEFFVIATRKLKADPILVKEVLHGLAIFETVVVTPQMISNAVDCSVTSRISFWDALIVAAAESARCSVLWTEDLNHGQVIRGVRVHNPFRR